MSRPGLPRGAPGARPKILCCTPWPSQYYVASKLTFSREPGQSDLTVDEFKAWTRNAWFIPAVLASDANGNPAAFPVELPRRLIKLYSYVDDLVSIRSSVVERRSQRR